MTHRERMSVQPAVVDSAKLGVAAAGRRMLLHLHGAISAASLASLRSEAGIRNPIANERNPYLPLNAPSIGDLMDMFHF